MEFILALVVVLIVLIISNIKIVPQAYSYVEGLRDKDR